MERPRWFRIHKKHDAGVPPQEPPVGGVSEESRSGKFSTSVIKPTKKIVGAGFAIAGAQRNYTEATGDNESADTQFVAGELEVLQSFAQLNIKSNNESGRSSNLRRIAGISVLYARLQLFEGFKKDKFLERPKDEGRLTALRWVFKRPNARLEALLPDPLDVSRYVLTKITIR